MGLSLAGYRPWEGTLRSAWRSPWPIARTALRMVFRRKLFWVLYVLALFDFLVFFFGIYLLSQIKDVAAQQPDNTRIFGDLKWMVKFLEERLNMGGTWKTYANFFLIQGYIVMAVLAMAGSILVGNDYHHGSLPFYLSKPLNRWHYLLGKFLAVALFINMMTTLPALGLFAEYGLLNDWSYYRSETRLFWGILGYGALVTICLSLMVVAVAAWLRKTVPLVLVWVGILVFCRVLGRLLVDVLGFDRRFRLIDMWNNLYLVGTELLGRDRPHRGAQPEYWEAAIVVAGVCVLCLIYLHQRIRAVEIVR